MTEVNNSSLALKMVPDNPVELMEVTEKQKDPPNQTWLLFKKNAVLMIKNFRLLIFLTIAPFVLSAFLYMFQTMANDQSERSWIDNPVTSLSSFPKCTGDGCVTLVYANIVKNTTIDKNPPWVSHTINYIRQKGQFGNDDLKPKGNNGLVVTDDDWQGIFK